jgi:hypothetical protein
LVIILADVVAFAKRKSTDEVEFLRPSKSSMVREFLLPNEINELDPTVWNLWMFAPVVQFLQKWQGIFWDYQSPTMFSDWDFRERVKSDGAVNIVVGNI